MLRTLIGVMAAIMLVAGTQTPPAKAGNDSEVLGCYWLKQQARKLNTEKAWRKYRDCVRSHG